ncbi:hypothetical protein L1987_22686 [Smallanthus sonchifolius]|uniref:Uncharacterized protein n=1 Tax=Smallanthus sonchifolius TaxID=185202 RepID=A0ACB9IH12_9ASTR|nr:hypothetical protein L1987_22686 [Smallanthus sonchifolius]
MVLSSEKELPRKVSLCLSEKKNSPELPRFFPAVQMGGAEQGMDRNLISFVSKIRCLTRPYSLSPKMLMTNITTKTKYNKIYKENTLKTYKIIWPTKNHKPN